ncbi:IS3 family transposase [Sphingobacterium multivorum]|uniref:IS3 family transposase n=1 Tax=Sphingobacterium multivorum TaxID=28454 RepID=UPI0031BB1007
MCRSQYYYVSKKNDSAVISALDDRSTKHPVYGFRKLYAYLHRAGKPWNHKKVYRVYKLLNMNKKRRGKRRLPVRKKQPLEQQVSINQKWSMDFMYNNNRPHEGQGNLTPTELSKNIRHKQQINQLVT